MKIVIRTDASIKMGSGHVMRCLTLAESLREQGASIMFVSRKHEGNLNQIITEKYFQVKGLNPPVYNKKSSVENKDIYKDWLGVSEQQDAQDTIDAIREYKPNWLIIDHYSLGEKWEKELRSFVKNIFVIDDIANRRHDCDMLLDQNWFEDMDTRYDYLTPQKCIRLFGPKFALLRQEFAEARRALKPKEGLVKRVFIFFGGSDLQNLTEMTLRALVGPEFSHLKVDVAIGNNNASQEEILKIERLFDNINLHIQVNSMANIMSKADLAIGAGGVNTWERICLDIPSVVIIAAENQRSIIQGLNKYKYVNLLDDYKNITQDKISSFIKILIKNKEKINNNKLLVDGLGAKRISKYLL